jgi:hypothetical protein
MLHSPLKFRVIAFWLAACLVSVRPAFSASYPPDSVRQDLKFLYETLQASHYDLFAHVPKEDYDREFARLDASIKGEMDDVAVYRALQSFAAKCGMAHCNLSVPFNSAYVPYVMNGGTLIPFDLTFVGEDSLIWHNYSNNPAVASGTKIVAIDGKPITAVLAGITALISGDSAYMQRTSIETMSFARYHWLAYGEAKTYALTLQKPDGATFVVEVAAVPAQQLEQKAAANPPITQTSRELRFIGSVAYLRPGIFLNQSATDVAGHDAFERGEFIQFIDSAFREVREKKASALILDLRGNPGGDNSFSDPMIAYFADRPFRFCSRFDVRTSPVTKDFWKGVDLPALAALKAEILSRKNGERFPFEIPFVQPRDPAERFHGKLYVLVDRFTYSNAVATAAIVQDFKFGVVVGQTTADVPTTYGAAHQFKLQHTQLLAMYPKARLVRPSGDDSPGGVRPDEEIADNVFTPEDEILQRALTLVQAAAK